MGKLLVLVGPIASGKSTYAKARAKEGAIVVNDDAIVLAVHGGDYSLYDAKLKALYKGIQLQMIVAGVMLGRDVIVDSTNRTPKTRQRYIRLAESLDVPCGAVVFPNHGPAVHAERRFNADARGLSFETWFNVAQRHQEKYSEPGSDEGFDMVWREER